MGILHFLWPLQHCMEDEKPTRMCMFSATLLRCILSFCDKSVLSLPCLCSLVASTSTCATFVSCGRSMRILCQQATVASHNCIILGRRITPLICSSLDPHSSSHSAFLIHRLNLGEVASQGKISPQAVPHAPSGEYEWPNFVSEEE